LETKPLCAASDRVRVVWNGDWVFDEDFHLLAIIFWCC
jgi:hypothetical protein